MKTKQREKYERELNAKRNSLSLDGEQELCCIALLLRENYVFELIQPRGLKQNKVIESYFYKIKQIKQNDQIIELDKLIETELNNLFPCYHLSGLIRNTL